MIRETRIDKVPPSCDSEETRWTLQNSQTSDDRRDLVPTAPTDTPPLSQESRIREMNPWNKGEALVALKKGSTSKSTQSGHVAEIIKCVESEVKQLKVLRNLKQSNCRNLYFRSGRSE